MAATTEPTTSGAIVQAEIYDTERFSTLYLGSRNPPMGNLGLAAAYMISLFRRHEITFAFMGGWALFLRGGQRSTQDIDLAVAGYMDDLKAIMSQERRYVIFSVDEDAHTNGFVPASASHRFMESPQFKFLLGLGEAGT